MFVWFVYHTPTVCSFYWSISTDHSRSQHKKLLGKRKGTGILMGKAVITAMRNRKLKSLIGVAVFFLLMSILILIDVMCSKRIMTTEAA